MSKVNSGLFNGTMCSSYSGRCVLSNHFTGRDANRGGCAQICRWEFPLYDENNNVIESSNQNGFDIQGNNKGKDDDTKNV